jgi:hypothetical protein
LYLITRSNKNPSSAQNKASQAKPSRKIDVHIRYRDISNFQPQGRNKSNGEAYQLTSQEVKKKKKK